ncbi:hypothetical protein M406DRAFT_277264 [Cryphonectria parasitica EP155]|uniref:Uncharacterized protein n=1 Tax=Cryphonectria parasitica (strain ATCC 38755 / EP155) TaxID=660469 RepID=A0A9P5CQS1_CRYP1|nr:uncharacterized protein M406DRAFT_277264 [Cryphonectria parasitica EP155]KAF3766370.1 hypothetical protein M406DRAFT_277264 [Cryphonectria parasitica EP155]
MACFDSSYTTASPVLGIQPQVAHQSPFDRPIFSHSSQSFGHSVACTSRPILHSNATFAGRKRSRDEAAPNLDEPEKVVPAPKVEEAEDEWEYGPGMILIKKKTGYVVDATSQSGTWVEDKAAHEHGRKLEEAIAEQEKLSQERPSLRSHKSQRLTMTSDTPAPVQAAQSNKGSPGRDNSPEAPSQPVVDEFTMHLGIGWAQLSTDEHIQAAARGWQRYIENHFPVTDAKIRLQSKGLNAYLVEGREGFFLFADNLREGRLVSRNAYCALQNLKTSPPVFDGQSMAAATSPRASAVDATPLASTTTVPDMDVDMS